MKKLAKTLLCGLLAGLMVLSVTGCGSQPAASGSAAASASGGEDVTLNALFMKQAGYSEDDVNAMTADFMAANPGIKVNVTFVAYEELEPKILTSAQSGGYDVVLGDCIWPAQFAKAGLVLDVTDRMSELDTADIYEGALDSTKYEGKYYGIPWLNDCKYLFCNMDMLAQAGITTVPATWDELMADAKTLKDKGIVEYPIAACYAQAECLVCDYTCLSGAFGGSFVDENNNPTLNSPENVAALDFMYQGLKDGLTNPKSLEMIEDDVLSTFTAGNAAFAVNWTYMNSSMNDEAQSSVAGKCVIAPIPGTDKATSATVNGGMPLMITAGSKHPDEAWLYMSFLASKDVQSKYCSDALPIWKSLYTDPDVIAAGGEDVVNASNIQYQYIVNRPQVPYYNELSTDMQTELQNVLLGNKTAQEALDGLQAQAESLAKG
jgi:multiple sugar transport system substrate-binding protein